MKPEDRRRLKQHIEMIVEHNTPSNGVFCPNCECDRETILYSEVRECTVCHETFEVVCGIKPSNSDVSMTERVLMIIKNRAVQAIEYALPIHEGIDWYIDDNGIIGAVHQIEPVSTKERLAIITNVLANDVLHLIQQLESISKELSTTEFHDSASKQSRDFWKNYALQVNSKMLMQIEFIRKLLSLGTVLNDRLKDEAISLLDDRLSNSIEEKGCKNDK